MKKSQNMRVHGTIILLSLLSILFLFSCEENTGPTESTTSVTRKLIIYSLKDSMPANGGSTQILVKVYAGDDTTHVTSGVKVTFSANQSGTKLSIQTQNDITDANGYARATLYAGSKSGTAAITGSIENFSNTIFVTITQGAGLVTADPSTILANGLTQSTITATVIDSLGQPLPGAQVSFIATGGATITTQSYSDQDGHAVAILKSVPSITDITCTVTATTEIGKIALVKAVPEGAAKNARTENMLGTTTVVFRGITVTGSTGKNTFLANNADSTQISINVKETTSGNPIEGAVLSFSTGLGQVSAEQGVTDSNGNAVVILYGANIAGTAVFSAVYAEGLEYVVQFSLIKELFMSLKSKPSVLLANGTDISIITAVLSDADNNPIQGETIYFSTTYGTILPSSVTNEWGEATVNLRSPRSNGVAQVKARYGLIEKTTPVEFIGAILTISANPLILVADGESKSKLTISLSDASSLPVVDEKITLSASSGTLYSADLKAAGVSLVDFTSTNGKITAYLSSLEDNDVVVTAATTGLQERLIVHFTDYTFTLMPSKTEILAGGEEVQISAVLKDKNENITPIRADDVEFSTTLGTIISKETSENGSVIARLVSGNNAGLSTITASIKNPPASASTSVTFLAAGIGSIQLETSKSFVRIGGNTVDIIAKVFDETGNPKAGETVTFSVLKGPGGGEKLDTGSAITNEIGQAVISFISGMTGSEQNGVVIRGSIGNISDTVSLTITGQPDKIVVGFNTSSFTTNQDGTYGIQISAIVSDVNRNMVVDGTIVNFSLIGDVGVIEPEVETVGGVASTILVYLPSDAGKAVKLTASAGGKEGSITFFLPGFLVSYISVSAEKKTLLADGKDSTMVKATLFDKNGSSANVPDGTTVSFTTDAGTLNPFVTTTVNGEAITWLRSDKTPRTNIKVTAQSGLYSDFTYVHFEEVGSTVNQVADIDVTLDKDEVEANGTSSVEVTATLKKFNGEVVDRSTTVEFETDIGQITHYAASNTEGKAIAYFSSGQIGTATIRVTVGNAVGFASVIIRPGPPKSIELIFPVPPGEDKDKYVPYVYVKGSGQNETLIVSATARDSKNNYVADGNLVKFALVGTFDDEDSLTPEGNTHSESSPVPTLNGIATVSFHAGKRAGAVRMKATIIDPQTGLPFVPSVTSETTQILVYAGPPYLDTSNPADPFTNSRMTIYSGPLNIFVDQIGTEYNQSTITVTISDKYKNPVPPGTSVYFTTTGGYITTNTGYTNINGMAMVTLYGGNPYPTLNNSSMIPNPNTHISGSPNSFAVPTWSFDAEDLTPNNGIAVITAQTEGRDQNGNNMTVFNYAQVVFSRTVATFTITADKDTVYRGDKADIIITIHDMNENPIVGGSTLTLSSTLGTLSQRSITTGDPGQIKYHVTLSNDLDPLAGDNPGYAVVTVKLESPNGSGSIEKSVYLSTSSF